MSNEDVRALIASNVTEPMLLGLRTSMIVIPLILIVVSYLIYRYKYKIDTKFYSQITKELTRRIISEKQEL